MQTALTHESGSADPQSKRLQSLGDCGEERTTCNVGVFGPTDQDAGEAVSKGGCRGTFCIESFSQALLYEAPDSASPLRTSTLCEYESASNDTSRDAESGASYEDTDTGIYNKSSEKLKLSANPFGTSRR